MKQIFFAVVCCLILTVALPVNAQENVQKVGEGYTAEGVYYVVYATENSNISVYSTSIYVTRTVKYSGEVVPAQTLPWTEIINGVTYSGELTISHWTCSPTETVATYKGTLYAG